MASEDVNFEPLSIEKLHDAMIAFGPQLTGPAAKVFRYEPPDTARRLLNPPHIPPATDAITLEKQVQHRYSEAVGLDVISETQVFKA